MTRRLSAAAGARLLGAICLAGALVAGLAVAGRAAEAEPARRPNILLCLADNFSWEHLPPYGPRVIESPAFDRIVREGVVFRHAFCPAPSCAPSRAAILAGQDVWRLAEAANLCSSLPARIAVYPDLLARAGYWTGHAGKGWAPGALEATGRTVNPAGPSFADFREFLATRPAGTPFCFWHGDRHSSPPATPVAEPGVDLDRLEIPPFLPDCDAVRADFRHYFGRLRRFDAAVAGMLAALDEAGELDDTLVVYTADNGMDFPRGYPNLYDHGARMFLAIRWGRRVPGGRTLDDFVNLIDLAPTFLEAAGVAVPPEMTGRSLVPLLESGQEGVVDPTRDRVYTARERHAWARRGGLGYPMRAVRTRDHLFIRNVAPDRWPAGDPDYAHPGQGLFGDVDRCATKTWMLERRDDPAVKPLFDLAFGKRSAEELYDLRTDPCQMRNLAAEPEHGAVKAALATDLDRHLRQTGDPRATGGDPTWDRDPYHSRYRDKLE
jgi:N-sulfoglucosamine sulfohydrolase